jgi:DNA-directed RNA polymerase specialized sigma24 family protein
VDIEALRSRLISYAIAQRCYYGEAEDIAHDIIVRALTCGAGLEQRNSYWYRAVHNRIIDLKRRAVKQNRISLPDDFDVPDENIILGSPAIQLPDIPEVKWLLDYYSGKKSKRDKTRAHRYRKLTKHLMEKSDNSIL